MINPDRSTSGGPAGVYTGLRVLDFSMFLAGPYCTRLMADMGAEIWKVEPPNGDFLRATPPVRDGRSAYFGHLNCGKKSLCLDLKRPASVAVIKRLVSEVDIVLENFRPGVMARLGLDYETLSEIKPNLIYCSVTGYGQSGPRAHRPSFAPIIHAASGFEMLTPRYEDSLDRPIRNRNAMADYLAATHALAGIGAALFHRSNTGRGEHLDIALMDTMHHAMSCEYVGAQFPETAAPPTFRPLRTQDGFISIAPVSDGNFKGLVAAAGHPEWAEDPRFASHLERVAHWTALYDVVEEWSETQTSLAAETALLAAGCPASVYRTIGEAQKDAQVAARQASAQITDGSGSYNVAGCPLRFAEAPSGPRPWVAELGQHTDEVLATVGYSPSEVEALRTDQAIVTTKA